MNDNNDTGASAPQLSPLTDAASLCREFLDAIPEAAALFDPLGRLMAVNGAWRQLVTACHPAARALAADAVAAGSTADGGASAGIRAVLEGREAIFVMPCAERGGEAGHCDFQLQATPMQLGAWRGALVRLLDGSARE